MKLKFLIFVILILDHGRHVVSEELSEEELRKSAKSILQRIQDIWTQFADIQEKSLGRVVNKLLENPDIKRIHTLVKESLDAKNITAERASCIDEHYRQLAADVNLILLQRVAERIKGDSNYFVHVASELTEIRNALDKSLDAEVQLCVNNGDSCRLTGEYIDETDQSAKFLEEHKGSVINAVDEASEFFNSEDVLEKVQKDFLSEECVQGN